MRNPSPCRLARILAVGCLSWSVLSAPASQAQDDGFRSAEEIVEHFTTSEGEPMVVGRTKGVTWGKEADSPTLSSAPESRMEFRAIQFALDSAELTGTALRQLEALATALDRDAMRPFFFAILGHTDSHGNPAYNRDLSTRRAGAVKRHLVAADVSPRRLVDVGLGMDFPLPDISSYDGRNRRVEIVKLGRIGSEPPAHRSRRKAVLIGIDRYRHVSPLNGPVNDAKAMQSFILDVGFGERDIRMLLDLDATRGNILAAIDWLVERTDEGDEALLYFSGHGFQQRDENGDELDDRLDEALVPVDAVVREDGTLAGMITDDEMAASLARLSGRRVQVIVDSSFSAPGTGSSASDGDWRYVKNPRRPDGRRIRPAPVGRRKGSDSPEAFLSSSEGNLEHLDLTVWTAVTGGQQAFLDEAPGAAPGSVFTRRMLWGVRDGKADLDRDHIVTRSELRDYLVRESDAYCKRNGHRCPQGLTPGYHATPGRTRDAAFARLAASSPGTLVQTTSEADIPARLAERLASHRSQGVRLHVEPGRKLKVGTRFRIVVESDRGGRLVLLDIDAAGRMVQLSPSTIARRSGVPDRIDAGTPISLPGARAGAPLRAAPPTGRSTLLAVVSEDTPQLHDLVSRHLDLAGIRHPGAYLVEMSEVLRAAEGPPDRAAAVATVHYDVLASSP